MGSVLSLTPTSFIVLGLVRSAGKATPYDLKQRVARSVGHFWSVPHTQLYTEPDRLTAAGYLVCEREPSGRRRKVYTLSPQGRRALEDWLGTPPDPAVSELRDPALLKVFFGADPAMVAGVQLPASRQKLAEYGELLAVDDGSGPRGPWLALHAAVVHTREWVRFWERLACQSPDPGGRA